MQTGALFSSRIGSTRKALKGKGVEFVALDAPFVASEVLSAEQLARFGGGGDSGAGRTWFTWQDEQTGDGRPSRAVKYGVRCFFCVSVFCVVASACVAGLPPNINSPPTIRPPTP